MAGDILMCVSRSKGIADVSVLTCSARSVDEGIRNRLNRSGLIPLSGPESGIKPQADRVEYPLMQEPGEALLKNPPSKLAQQILIVRKSGPNITREFRLDVVRPQFGDPGNVLTGSHGRSLRGVNGPDTVAL